MYCSMSGSSVLMCCSMSESTALMYCSVSGSTALMYLLFSVWKYCTDVLYNVWKYCTDVLYKCLEVTCLHYFPENMVVIATYFALCSSLRRYADDNKDEKDCLDVGSSIEQP
jgi:hypothetical protein